MIGGIINLPQTTGTVEDTSIKSWADTVGTDFSSGKDLYDRIAGLDDPCGLYYVEGNIKIEAYKNDGLANDAYLNGLVEITRSADQLYCIACYNRYTYYRYDSSQYRWIMSSLDNLIDQVSQATLTAAILNLIPQHDNLWVDYTDNNHIRNSSDGRPTEEATTGLCSGLMPIPDKNCDYYISACKNRENPYFIFFDAGKNFLKSVKIGSDIPGYTDKTGYCILSKNDIPQDAVYVAINADYSSRYFGKKIPTFDNIAIRYANDGLPHISTDIVDVNNPSQNYNYFLGLPDGVYILDGFYESTKIELSATKDPRVSGLFTVKHEKTNMHNMVILSFLSSGLVCVRNIDFELYETTDNLYTSSGWAQKVNTTVQFDD